MFRRSLATGIIIAALLPTLAAQPSFALTSKDCRARYKAAKAAGIVDGLAWEEYQHLMCSGPATTISDVKPRKRKKPSPADQGAESVEPGKALDPKNAVKTVAPIKPSTPKDAAKTTRSNEKANPNDASNTVFPNAVDTKYAKLQLGKARFQTCLDQYHANEGDGGNGGLKWTTKGGGYYSKCNKALKD